MIQFQNNDQKRTPSKGLLAVALLLSFFSFTGFTVCSPQQKQITPTELVVSIRGVNKRAHSFKSAIVSFREKDFLRQLNADQIRFVFLNDAQIVKIKFGDASRKAIAFKRLTGFFEQLSIPYSYEEESFNSSRG